MKTRSRPRHDTLARLARSMRTPKEEKEGVGLFDTAAWIERKNARVRRAGLPANYRRQRYNTPEIKFSSRKNKVSETKKGGWLRGIANRFMELGGIDSPTQTSSVMRTPSV